MFSRLIPFLFTLLIAASMLFMNSCGSCNQPKVAMKDTTDTAKLGPDYALVKSLTAKIHADPTDPENYFKRAELYFQNNNVKNAYWDMQKAMKLDSSNVKYYFTLTDIFMKGGYADGATDVLNKLLRREPDNTEAMNKLSKVYFYEKDYDNSLKQLNKLLKKDDNNPEAYFIMGMNLKEMGDTAKALAAFQKATQHKQDFYDAYMQLGLLSARKRNDVAIQYFNNALRIDSLDPQAWYAKAKYYQDAGMEALNKHSKAAAAQTFEAAKETYRRLIQKKPDYKEAYFNLGFIYLQQDSLDKAYKYFDFAVKVKPQYAEAYYYRGLCEEAKGNIDQAKTDINNALSLKPDYDLAKKELETLNKKR